MLLSLIYEVHARVCHSFNFRDWHFGNPGFIFLITMTAIAFPIAVLGNIKDYKDMTWSELFAAMHPSKWGKSFWSSLNMFSIKKKLIKEQAKDFTQDYK